MFGMSAAGGKRALVVAALLVAGIRMWMQLRGKARTPFAEWAVGWGALFFFLALVSEVYPQAAGALSLTVVVGDLLANGSSLFTDVSGAITGAEKGQGVFTPSPFSPVSQASVGAPRRGVVQQPAKRRVGAK